MRVKPNANYTVLMSSVDVDNLIQGKSVTFWITYEGEHDLTFKLKKE